MFGKVKETSGSGVPVGIYQAEFVNVEPTPAKVWNGKELPPGFRFDFKVLSGPHSGAIASRIPSGQEPKFNRDKGPNGLAKFLTEVTGIPATSGVDYGEVITSYFGKTYNIVVKQGAEGGGTNSTVSPMF